MLAVLAVVPVGQPVSAQDTVRVRADNPPLWGANVRLIQELAIGQVDGPQEYAFGRIYHGAAESGGAFYLFDVNDRQIRRYDAQGRFTGKIGKQGGGPGEYESMAGMAVNARGELVVFDAGTRRVTHFGPDGKMRREVTLNRNVYDAFALDNAGRMYLMTNVGDRMIEGAGVQYQYLRFSQEGTLLDSLRIPTSGSDAPALAGFVLVSSDGMRSNFIERRLRAPYLAGGVLGASSHTYRFVVSDGRRVTSIERSIPGVRLGDEERAQWLEWADSFKVRNPRGQYEIPRVKPFIRDIRSDHVGRIWVDVYVAAERRTNLPPRRDNGGKQILYWRERTTYDVFAPDGRYLGRVALPEESQLLTISGNRLYTLGRGRDGEERLVVFRLDIP
jgi:sugar lactone lactonase YvrE